MGPTATLTFTCSICVEPSHDICVYCTKDVCHSHRCQRCLRCSDCCECESPLCLDEVPVAAAIAEVVPDPVEAPVEVFEPAVFATEPEAFGTETDAPPEGPALDEEFLQPESAAPTEPDPASPDEPLPGTSTDGSW
jgi:hypothetical protein